eukprot:3599347-Amphidinium_carterae.1
MQEYCCMWHLVRFRGEHWLMNALTEVCLCQKAALGLMDVCNVLTMDGLFKVPLEDAWKSRRHREREASEKGCLNPYEEDFSRTPQFRRPMSVCFCLVKPLMSEADEGAAIQSSADGKVLQTCERQGVLFLWAAPLFHRDEQPDLDLLNRIALQEVFDTEGP